MPTLERVRVRVRQKARQKEPPTDRPDRQTKDKTERDTHKMMANEIFDEERERATLK